MRVRQHAWRLKSRLEAAQDGSAARPGAKTRFFDPCSGQRHRRVARLGLCAGLALLAAILGLGLMLPGAPAARQARAASARPQAPICSGPCVGILSPIFNNAAEGPVGATLTLDGANWPANTTVTIWPGVNQDACAQTPSSTITGTLAVDGSGTASGTYFWPLSVNMVNQSYLLCASDGAVTISPGTQDNQPNSYLVLSANPPALSLSAPALNQGDTLTVSGQNWTPAQPVTVNICSDANCATPALPSQQVTSNDDGTFEVQFSISSSMLPGAYYVQATTNDDALMAPLPKGAPVQFMVNAPTPTPSPSPSPTMKPTPTPTPAPSRGSQSNIALLIFVLGTLSVLFLIGGIISLAVYTRTGP